MNDRELLVLAAEAANVKIGCLGCGVTGCVGECGWNPLKDDGDALRLAVKLEMQVEYLEFTGNARARSRVWGLETDWCVEYCMSEDLSTKNPNAAVRRAIVRAAAEVCNIMNLLQKNT